MRVNQPGDKLPNGTTSKHITIYLPGEAFPRIVISKQSLLWLSYVMERESVWLAGFADYYVQIRSLSSDLLRRKVLMYKIDGPRTMTVILEGSGYQTWSE